MSTPLSSHSRAALLVGRDTVPAEPVALSAGPVSAILQDGDLRRVRIGDVELAQRIYVAVRDDVWNTIPGVISDLDVRAVADGFEVGFLCRHRYEDIDFTWRAEIRGEADGRISYAMAGTPQTAFRYAKIGLNVHHPLRECVGRPYRAWGPHGEQTGTLPTDIEPQLLVDGQLTALFPEYEGLEISYEDGLSVRFDFAGDLVEMQDHRNWTDANLKSYWTPMSAGWPFDSRPGEEIRQAVTLSFSGPRPAPARRPAAVTVEVGAPIGRGIPPVGLGLTGHEPALAEDETALLARTRPAHVRLDIVLGADGSEQRLGDGLRAAQALDAALELALYADDTTADAAARLAPALQGARVARVLVYAGAPGFGATSGSTTPAALVQRVRSALSAALPGVAFAGGTDQFFTELNRNHPETDGVDGIVYSLNPQVHAADDLSLMENLRAQGETVRMTSKLGGGLPVFVSPVTLVGRHGPFPAGPPQDGDLPGDVDVRHAALFGAAWTVGSLAELSGTDVAALTYYETVGPRGLLMPAGAPEDDRLPAAPGEALPVYHVLADVAELRAAPLLAVESSDRESVVGLAVGDGDGVRVLLANLTPRRQAVTLRLPGAGDATVRTLDAATGVAAMRDPVAYRRSGAPARPGAGGGLDLEMDGYAVLRVDAGPQH